MSGFHIGDIETSDCVKKLMSRYIGIISWIQEREALALVKYLCIHNCGNVQRNKINQLA